MLNTRRKTNVYYNSSTISFVRKEWTYSPAPTFNTFSKLYGIHQSADQRTDQVCAKGCNGGVARGVNEKHLEN